MLNRSNGCTGGLHIGPDAPYEHSGVEPAGVQRRRARFGFGSGNIELRVFLLLAAVLIFVVMAAAAPKGDFRIAIFPVQNLTGSPAPTKEVTQFFIQRLMGRGFNVLDDGALERFLARHRIRYAAGIDAATAQALKEETSTAAVLFVSIELYDPNNPPKVAMICRLVSTGENPRVLWADDVGLAGDEAPGLLELGLVMDGQKLMNRALDDLAKSLEDYLTEQQSNRKRAAKKI